ncbi:hypothetical protein C2G38_641375 [Gigaspora rosea]|uniref:P-loop containing nucleoside triphosphate hydrolase protein n=1 Tax=Gigaspora rosea TaxID=44941 RepID=A0A397U762_9GLOM|nr:hypothetical protein C2G38_641375 [Gigaspora rosea]
MHTHSRNNKTYFVEFLDVGGTSKHKSSRNMFYHQINGIILVHDVSNRKSYHNLWKWLSEVIYSEAYKESERVNNVANANWGTGSGSGSGSWMSGGSMSFNSTNDYDFELQIGERHASVPILVVGTKADLVKQELTGRQRRYSIVDEYGGECVNLKIDAFFEKVIDKKFGITTDHYQNVTSGSFTTSIPTVTKKQVFSKAVQYGNTNMYVRTKTERNFDSMYKKK